MRRLDGRLDLLDPVDRGAPEPDGEPLLRRILRAPAEPERPRRRIGPRGGLAAAAALVAAGAILVAPGPAGTNVVAAAYDALDQPGTILHYEQRWTAPGSAVAPRQVLGTTEVWQTSDGRRLRSLMRASDGGTVESVLSSEESRSFDSLRDRLVIYDEDVPPAPAPAGGGHRKDLGDPRTLLRRARDGDETVTELGEATVRGIPVLQFRVGECRVVERRVPVTVHPRGRPPQRTTTLEQQITRALLVSVARDGYAPVRIEEPPCREAPPGAQGRRIDELPGITIDFLSFETLPATAANERLLRMSPHPGARVVDGEAVDAAEERDERR